MKRPTTVILASAAFAAVTALAQDSDMPEAWPEQDLARFVFEHLDISSFRNSTGPRRSTGDRFLGDIGVVPTSVTEDEATSDDDDWAYTVRVLGKQDYNKDAVEEVLICFHDRARNGGTYNTQNHFVLQLVGGRAIALATTEPSKAEEAGCASFR